MPAPIIAIAVNNGGAGKSTVTRCLAESAAVAGLRVLVIDTDDTAMLTSYMLLNRLPAAKREAAEAHLHRYSTGTWLLKLTPFDQVVQTVAWQYRGADGQTREIRLDLVPAHPSLSEAYAALRSDPPGAPKRLRVLTRKENLRDRYDLILVDSQPGLEQLGLLNAVLAADGVVIPCELAAGGIQQVERTLQWLEYVIRDDERYAHPVQPMGVIANRYTAISADVPRYMQWLEETLPAEYGVGLLGRPIPARAHLNRANQEGTPIPALWRECDAAVIALYDTAVLLDTIGLDGAAGRLRSQVVAMYRIWQARKHSTGGEQR